MKSASSLMQLISLVDRPHQDAVVALAKRAERLPNLVAPLATAVVTFLLLWVFQWPTDTAILAALSTGFAAAIVFYTNDNGLTAIDRHDSIIAKVLAGLGLFTGLGIALLLKQEVWIVLAAAAGGFCLAWIIAKIGMVLLSLAVNALSVVLRAFASPVAFPILSLFASYHRHVLRTRYKEWSTSKGTPIIEFNGGGVKSVHHDNEPIFVASSRLRMGGAALAAGVPLFTFSELLNRHLVDQRTNAALAALRADGSAHGLHADASFTALEDGGVGAHPLMQFNPANGLPMMDGIGSLDVAGNVFGTDSNHHHSMGQGGFDTH